MMSQLERLIHQPSVIPGFEEAKDLLMIFTAGSTDFQPTSTPHLLQTHSHAQTHTHIHTNTHTEQVHLSPLHHCLSSRGCQSCPPMVPARLSHATHAHTHTHTRTHTHTHARTQRHCQGEWSDSVFLQDLRISEVCQ